MKTRKKCHDLLSIFVLIMIGGFNVYSAYKYGNEMDFASMVFNIAIALLSFGVAVYLINAKRIH